MIKDTCVCGAEFCSDQDHHAYEGRDHDRWLKAHTPCRDNRIPVPVYHPVMDGGEPIEPVTPNDFPQPMAPNDVPMPIGPGLYPPGVEPKNPWNRKEGDSTAPPLTYRTESGDVDLEL